jgi:hypothetical protein
VPAAGGIPCATTGHRPEQHHSTSPLLPPGVALGPRLTLSRLHSCLHACARCADSMPPSGGAAVAKPTAVPVHHPSRMHGALDSLLCGCAGRVAGASNCSCGKWSVGQPAAGVHKAGAGFCAGWAAVLQHPHASARPKAEAGNVQARAVHQAGAGCCAGWAAVLHHPHAGARPAAKAVLNAVHASRLQHTRAMADDVGDLEELSSGFKCCKWLVQRQSVCLLAPTSGQGGQQRSG